jgi:hypothetical protein
VNQGKRIFDAHQDQFGVGVGVGEDIAERDRPALPQHGDRCAVGLLHGFADGHSGTRCVERRDEAVGLLLRFLIRFPGLPHDQPEDHE